MSVEMKVQHAIDVLGSIAVPGSIVDGWNDGIARCKIRPDTEGHLRNGGHAAPTDGRALRPDRLG